ncbi:MAG: CvpA family protein [Clostridia bacterium]|nr:CvpA family protein [Clostridia bacterium]
MAYILDVVAVVLLLFFTLGGAKKGFIGGLFGFLTTIIALVVAFSLADQFADLTGGLFGLEGVIDKAITNKLEDVAGFNIDISATGIKEALKEVSVPSFIADALVDEFASKSVPAGTTLAMVTGGKIASFAIGLIAGVVLFFLCKIILRILVKVLNGVISLIPIVGALNALLGAVLGFIKGGLLVCVVLAILSIFSSLGITELMDQTLFIGGLFHDNPLSHILTWVIS